MAATTSKKSNRAGKPHQLEIKQMTNGSCHCNTFVHFDQEELNHR